jgi:hypothetical protein
MTGRTQELKAEKTTIGRLEDNTFPIAEPSVSSHHCEVVLRGSEVVVRDLNSTNGTYISGEKITEQVLKPGQILRLGQVELRLEADAAGPPPKREFDRTTVIAGGVKLTELEQGARSRGFAAPLPGRCRTRSGGAGVSRLAVTPVGNLREPRGTRGGDAQRGGIRPVGAAAVNGGRVAALSARAAWSLSSTFGACLPAPRGSCAHASYSPPACGLFRARCQPSSPGLQHDGQRTTWLRTRG